MRCMQPFIPELLAFPSVDQCLIEAGVSELEDPVSLNCDSKLPKEPGSAYIFWKVVSAGIWVWQLPRWLPASHGYRYFWSLSPWEIWKNWVQIEFSIVQASLVESKLQLQDFEWHRSRGSWHPLAFLPHCGEDTACHARLSLQTPAFIF